MGRKNCVVNDCDSNSDTVGVSLHRLPKEEYQKQRWIEFIGKVNTGSRNLPADVYICSQHFKSCCLHSSSLGKRSITPGHCPSMNPDDATETCQVKDPEDETKQLKADLQKTSTELLILKHKHIKLKQAHDSLMEEVRILKQYRKRHEELKRKSSQSTSEGPSVKRQAKSVDKDQTPIPRIITELLCPDRSNGSRHYSEDLKQFAFQLHHHSPRGYAFVRDTFQKSLPHPKSFNRWTKFIVTKPGFLDVSLNFIKNRCATYSYKMYYALILDEINIRKQIVYNGGKMKGFIDYAGFKCKVSPNTPATKAFFVLASEINGNKKVPIAYLLTDGVNSTLIHDITMTSLSKMHEISATVLSITFDGLKSNFTAMKMAGAEFDIENDKVTPYIRHPDTASKVFVFPDPVHMMKLLRNSLESCKSLQDANGNLVKWSYIRELMELQDEIGLRAGNKLTPRHVNFRQQKMKVKLCAQTFSNSVAVSLAVCRKLNLPEFVGSEATSEFLQLVDRLFDFLNSRAGQKGFKAPLRQTNRRFWKPFFKKAVEYLKELKWCVNGEYIPLYKTRKGTCIQGFVISIRALEIMMEEVIGVGYTDLEYLPVYKLSQDLLELFFAVIRSRFGWNNNPNIVQLEHGLKSVLCANLRVTLNGNVTAMDDTETRISPLGSIAALQEDKFPENEDELDQCGEEIPSLESCSPLLVNIVAYIAGYVGRSVYRKVKCSSCLAGLIPTNLDSILARDDCVLLSTKTNGGLFIPSEDLIAVCKLAEAEVKRVATCGLSALSKKRVLQRILQYSTKSEIFTSLRTQDSEEHPKFSDHVISLCRCIAEEYLKVRLHYMAKHTTLKIAPESNRNMCTKLVHFKGN